VAKCPTHKKFFPTEAIAEEALLAAWITYGVKEGQGPIAVYQCDECSGYHLTSRGPMNAKLAEQLSRGEIKKRRAEKDWIDRLKNKGKI